MTIGNDARNDSSDRARNSPDLSQAGSGQDPPIDSGQALCKQAEERAGAIETPNLETLSLEEARHLVHELRVHRIELEMQNEELRRAQEALEASRARYSDLYDLAPVGYVTLSEQGLILEANLTAATLLGVPRGALVKQRLTRFIVAEDQDIYYRHRRQLFETGESQVWELCLVSQEGAPFWTRFEASLGQDRESGAPLCRVTMSDITNFKRTEEALREAEKRYRNLFENAMEGIFQTTSDGGVLLANPALARMYGYSSPEEMISSVHSIADQLYVNPEDRRGFERLMVKRGEVKEFQARQRIKDGRILWTSINARAVYDEKGNISCYEGRVVDITERKEAEEVWKRYELLSKHALEMILFIGRDGRILEANEAALRTYGYEREEMLASGIHDLRAPHIRHLTEDLIARAFAEGFAIETEHVRKDGSVFPVEVSSRGVEAGGEPVLLSIIRDITWRKRAEEERNKLEAQLRQAQKMEAIGTLAGGIAHDFNNILGIIMGYAEITGLKLGKDSPEQKSIHEVVKAAHRAKDLVKQILTFSRSGDQERKPLQVVPVVKEALKLLRSTLPTTIEIRQEIDLPQDHGVILADPTQIHQMLMNLATNAAYAMREKGGVLRVRLSPVDFHPSDVDKFPELSPGKYLKLIVADTGHGMDQATLDRIFDPYFTTKGPTSGSGLGLAVVHGIVKSHKGSITATSEPGKGSSFHIYLPRLAGDDAHEEDSPAAIPTGSERILLVDDEAVLIEAIERMLEYLGYQVTATTSSAQALLMFREQPEQFDLVITDYTMPEMTGADLAHELVQIRGDIPIILCTGFSERINEEGARKQGISAFIMKPASLKGLAEAIRKVLGRGR